MSTDILTAIIAGAFAIVVALINTLILKIPNKQNKIIFDQMLNEVYEPLYLALRDDMFCLSSKLYVLLKDISNHKNKFILSRHERFIRVILSISDERIRQTEPYMDIAFEFNMDINITYNQLRRFLGYPYSDIAYAKPFNLSELKGVVRKIVPSRIIGLASGSLMAMLITILVPIEDKSFSFSLLFSILLGLTALTFIITAFQISRVYSKQMKSDKLAIRIKELTQEKQKFNETTNNQENADELHEIN